MTTIDRTNQRYVDQLLFWLRLRDVPGDQVGDILAEAQAHVAATGETLHEAFGPPRRYARQWGRPNLRTWRRGVPAGIGGLVGGGAMAAGALALGRGEPAALGLPAGWTALLGLVLLVATIALVDYDPVRDPRTGAAQSPSRTWFVLVLAAACTALGVLTFLLGLASAAA